MALNPSCRPGQLPPGSIPIERKIRRQTLAIRLAVLGLWLLLASAGLLLYFFTQPS